MKRCIPVLFFFCLLPAVAAGAERVPLILFDQGHGELFRADAEGDLDLSLLAGKIRESGARVETVGPLSAATLAGADALVLSGPFHPLTEGETAALLDFVQAGGRLAVMLHVGHPAAPLLARLGVYHSNGVVRETDASLDGEPLNFVVRDLAPHPLFAGLDRFAVFGAWAIDAEGEAQVIARSGGKAIVDLNGNGKGDVGEPTGAFGLAAAGRLGGGEFVVFGDDAIFQNKYLRDYNAPLGERLARWLRKEI